MVSITPLAKASDLRIILLSSFKLKRSGKKPRRVERPARVDKVKAKAILDMQSPIFFMLKDNYLFLAKNYKKL
ncbi:MAG: hypothetical protein LKJ84_02755 [Bacilli bacterium]|jgi:hypothetical protein|nr:hypothetical protein [Bacilli bacterium]